MNFSLKLFSSSLALLAALFLTCGALEAGVPGLGKPAKQSSHKLVEPTQAKDVDAFMAELSDEQARKLLHEKLKAQTSRNKKTDDESEVGGFLIDLFISWEASVRKAFDRQSELLANARQDIASGTIEANLTAGSGYGELVRNFFLLAVVCAVACAVSALAGRLCDSALRGASQGLALPNLGRAGVVLLNVVLRLLEVAVFFLAAFVLFLALIPASGPVRAMGMIVVVALSYALLIRALARILLSPDQALARPILLNDADALTLYRWFMVITLASVLLGTPSVILEQVGQAKALGGLVYALAGPLVSLILCAMIFVNRERVAGEIRGEEGLSGNGLRSLFARYWHYPAMLYALCIGMFWGAQALYGHATILLLVLSLFLIPGCIGVDLWLGKLLYVASGQDRVVIDLDQGQSVAKEDAKQELDKERDEARKKRTFLYYVPLIRKSTRVVLIAFTAFGMLKTWGVEIPLGWLFARDVLTIMLVGLGGLLLWEVIRIRIDRKLKEEGSVPGEELEEGGAGGSRSATLLMLLRKFLLCVIVVMGSLIALSSMGIDIGPLVAGAGVVGLAIGFGAQTLVKDIISGVFFLIDDAFRVGDYVEAGTAKGTVEQISLRSMKLRHPRGMLYTVPYGGLKILKNYSRDYIVSKLDFRVRYDADIEKIRKIIKRINKEIMANEEISKGMLSDIKSMGIRRMEDSAMILRIKFKSIPGHEFTVQKELYKRIQEEFSKNGVEFAHRNVTVYLPPEIQGLAGSDRAEDQDRLRAAITGAAAEAAAQMLEEEQAALNVKKKPQAE